MNRWMKARSALIAVVFFALGLVAADRMTRASASALPVAQEGNAGAFNGTEGAVVIKSQLIVIRGPKIYRIDPFGPNGPQRPWGTLAE